MTPPQPPPDLGCAVHPDGSLKDASEIEWHFDKDDETPLTAAQKSPRSGPASSMSSQSLHPFLLGCASEKVPNLSKDQSYADYKLSKKDWDGLEVIHEVL
jgi:hypothetical protein